MSTAIEIPPLAVAKTRLSNAELRKLVFASLQPAVVS
jgi:hypothetical protein